MRQWMSIAGGVASITIAAAAGCYSGDEGAAANGAAATTGASATDPAAGGDGSAPAPGAPTGLPCEVDALLAARCRSCHSSTPMAPMALVTYEDLAAPSKSDPNKSTAVAALERMTSTSSPMPPSGDRATDPEITAFRAWVDANLPRGKCGEAEPGADGGPAAPGQPSASGPVVCTSGKTWSNGNEGPTMQPGRACITCHESNGDHDIVQVGGTVYPTLRELDGCYGIPGGANVVITDASGKVFTLPVGPTGNFSLDAKDTAAMAMPFRAKVVRNGVERHMGSPQSTGDCNSCHTETGRNGAPGRILVP